MPRVPAESRATTVGKWLLALVIPASALALGSLPTQVLIVMSVLAALSCGLLWVDRDVRTTSASRWILVALAVLLGMTILQAVPLPASVAHALTPANADIWDRALSPLHEPGPSWHALSVAPSATRVEVLRGFFYGCVFVAALRVATLEHGETFLVRVIVVSASLMAFAALAHIAVSAEKVFGLYRPHEGYGRGRIAPLLNTNHLAAYMGIGACVSLGALLGRRSMPRALSGSMTLVLAATCVWQGSRGATAALLFGLALTLGLTFYAKRRFESARVEGAILAACAVAATIVVSVAFSESREHLLSQDFSKVDVAKRSMSLVAGSPWAGSGRGAFESVFSAVREGSAYTTWTNPEDIVVQWLVEWGVPVTVVASGLLGWALRPQVLLRAVRPVVGAWVAIVATVMHDLADFHLEVPGIVALVAACVAIVVSGRPTSSGESRRASGTSFAFARAIPLGMVVGTLAAVAFAWPDIGHMLAEERRRYSAEAVDASVSPERFRDDLRAAMLRYPAEPFLPLMGAVRAQVVDHESVVPWVARALERNPRFGRAHFVLARSLAVGHAPQARLEYRLAYENDETLRSAIVKEAQPIIDGPTAALELVPEGASGQELLDALVAAVAERLPSTAVILDVEVERRSPAAIAPLRRRAENQVSDVVGDAPWCVGSDACMRSAVTTTEELAKREPTKCYPHILVARLRVKKREVVAALDGLDAVMDRITDRAECQRQLIQLAFDNGQSRRGDLALEQLVRSGCGAAAECVDLYSWAASMEEGRGHYVRAVRLYRHILDVAPDRDDILERIGQLGDRDGLLTDALDAYRTLSMRHPSEPKYPARISELRARVQRSPAVPAP
jgi:hypothetical protein